jgi:hypothetical protein
MDGYEAMGFDVTQVTQDVEQSLFRIKTSMPLPVLVYGDALHLCGCGSFLVVAGNSVVSGNSSQNENTF